MLGPASHVYGLVSGHARLLLVGAEVSPAVILATLLVLRAVRWGLPVVADTECSIEGCDLMLHAPCKDHARVLKIC